MKGHFIDEVSDDEMKVYCVQDDLDSDMESCTLRLAGVDDACWIMAFRVELKSRERTVKLDRFDLKQLEGVELSDKALIFKRLFESMRQPPGEAGTRTPPPQLASLLFGSATSVQSKMDPMVMFGTALAKNALSTEISPRTEPSPTAGATAAAKEKLDNKFADLELRVMAKIDEVRKEQNEKLDRILKLLEGRTVDTGPS
jgi:hypothetical protein